MTKDLYPSAAFDSIGAPAPAVVLVESTPLVSAEARAVEEMKPVVVVEPTINAPAHSYQAAYVMPSSYVASSASSSDFSSGSGNGSFYAPLVTVTKSGSCCSQVLHAVCVGVCTFVALVLVTMIVSTAVFPTAIENTIPENVSTYSLYKQSALNVSTTSYYYDYQKFVRLSIQDIPSSGDYDTISVCAISQLSTVSTGRTGLVPLGMVNGDSSVQENLDVVTIPHCATGQVATFPVCDTTAPYLWIYAENVNYNDAQASYLVFQDTCISNCYCPTSYYQYTIIAGIVLLSLLSFFLLAALCCIGGCCCCCIAARRKESTTTSYVPIA